ncbi:MAG TPA: NADP oxidoreductase, partial [Candidatus Hydrogenedentes bacterium]|nr:NADP oxidoreductase [Candidatus Hydrogenedentota bacterium]
MAMLGTVERPLRVAVVGSGPSGFYAADALLKAAPVCTVDMFERQPTPYGLVRSGVAPDNMKIKSVTKTFEKIAAHERFRFFGNVEVGVTAPVSVLRRHYDAIIFACGTETNLRLSIPGEDLPGCHTATSFVGWYNGHPVYRNFHFDLTQEIAVVVGNVAVDVARILSRTADELKHTDISQDALDALAESRVREVHIIGRRGPAQAKFKKNEIRELG